MHAIPVGAPGEHRVAVFFNDIKRQREAEDALRASEARLRTLIEGIPQLVWRAVGEGEWTWSSPQWTSFTGQSADDALGLGWLDAVHPDDRDNALAAWRMAAARDGYETDFRLRHPANGGWRWFQSRAKALRDARGRVIEWLGSSTGIDDQIRAREVLMRGSEQLEALVAERTADLSQALDTLREQAAERERAEAKLRQGDKLRAIGQLTGGIAHDFNNMLQGITSSLAMARLRLGQGRPADLPGYLDRAEKAAQRAAALTYRLLAFARQQALKPEPVSFDTVARDMEDMIRRTVGPAVQVELKLADGAWLVMCDRNQLESALLNLCVNARDAMPDGGWLTVSTAELVLGGGDVERADDLEPGRYASIAVSDTGAGMTPEVLAQVFEPFFTTKPLGRGTGLGLGLSQIYGFVKQSGGSVRISTEPGQGTTVRLLLPFHGFNQNLGGGSQPETGRTLLLVEDEPDVRELTAEHLRELGHRVLEASGAAAALRLVQTGARIDLMVSDVGLPGGMDGRQLVTAVRELRPGLPVVLITGHAGNEPITAVELLRKPFEPDALARRVAQMLGLG
ncbi:hybrid sensor histidine kinase/response regulator [Derxia lacustris]|uniref:hybrid sensor histidine kinase/response regulator n=1 Tax=Derxia lacustris TaxID=764842 RepID=UPI000A176388|nr:PAS domain-containing hybrid sensor histidine kinase/response regulator [Derxia lacustris]